MTDGYDHLVSKTQAASGIAREEAFGELVARFESAAYGWAYNVLGDVHTAQDVVQDAFFTAYQRIDQLREPAAFPAWLKRIVLTYCHRRTRRKSLSLLPLDEQDAPVFADPAAAHEDRELKRQVTDAVRALPEHERVVTELFYITGCSQQEIAERLAVPLTTVKKRLQYARERLRETMPPMNVLYHQRGALSGSLPGYAGAAGDVSSADAELLRLLLLIDPDMFVTA